MRVLGLVLAGALALTASIGVQAGSLGPGYYPMPNGWNGDWHRTPGVSRDRVPNGCPGRWVCCSVPGVPYWVWVPGSAVFDYSFPDWRGPTDGWGNP